MEKLFYCLLIVSFIFVSCRSNSNSDNSSLNEKQVDFFDDEEDELFTEISLEEKQIEIKDLKKGKKSTCTFVLTNIGENPLIIKRLYSSCGCTVPQWEKKPINPGEKSEIVVAVTPDNKGYFMKTITFYANIKRGWVRLAVSGIVEE